MYSQCPDCQTRFRVTADALRAARGTVRCGRCGSAFDALERLTDSIPSAAADASSPSSLALAPDSWQRHAGRTAVCRHRRVDPLLGRRPRTGVRRGERVARGRRTATGRGRRDSDGGRCPCVSRSACDGEAPDRRGTRQRSASRTSRSKVSASHPTRYHELGCAGVRASTTADRFEILERADAAADPRQRTIRARRARSYRRRRIRGPAGRYGCGADLRQRPGTRARRPSGNRSSAGDRRAAAAGSTALARAAAADAVVTEPETRTRGLPVPVASRSRGHAASLVARARPGRAQ